MFKCMLISSPAATPDIIRHGVISLSVSPFLVRSAVTKPLILYLIVLRQAFCSSKEAILPTLFQREGEIFSLLLLLLLLLGGRRSPFSFFF